MNRPTIYDIEVDEDDMWVFSAYRWKIWSASVKKRWNITARVITPEGRTSIVYLHRLLCGFPKGKDVDHIDGCTLNNVRSNLRICTHAQNLANTSKRAKGKYKGVKYRADLVSKPWEVIFSKGYIGRFASAEEAARAYDKAAYELHGEFARINFPEEYGLRTLPAREMT